MRLVSLCVIALALSGAAMAETTAPTATLTPRPAPSAETLAAAPLLQSDVAPWAARPGIRDYMAVYPTQALQTGVNGTVELECLVEHDYGVACRVLSETPRNRGFADAALALSPHLRVAPTLASGQPTRGGRLYWDVNFETTGRSAITGRIPLPGATRAITGGGEQDVR